MATPVAPQANNIMSICRGVSASANSQSRRSPNQDVDEMLAEEMRRLSLQEQYQLDLDVQGKNMLAAIEPKLLSSMGLKALEEELKTRKDLKYYGLALSLNSKMVTSREFKLKFARAEMFDPNAAATRLEKYLEMMYESFGELGLLRPARLSDLDKVRRGASSLCTEEKNANF